MENKPVEVSVIIPNYNYARYLRQRIESVLSQTFTDYEIILLDDASTDDSLSVLNEYRNNEHVTHIEINASNTGSPFIQWQKGLALARGKYIWIAESDDSAEPLFLEKAVSVLNQHPQASLCLLGSYCIDEDSAILKTDFDKWTSKQLSRPHHIGVFNGLDYITHNLYWRNYIYNASGVVFRKDCFERIDDLSCFSMRYSGDWLFWIEMARQGDVIEIYEKLNKFRLHKNSTTKKAVASGGSVSEDMCVVKKMEIYIPVIDSKKKSVRYGMFYKDIKRLKQLSVVKKKLFSELVFYFEAGFKDYCYERLNSKFGWLMPWAFVCKKDRL